MARTTRPLPAERQLVERVLDAWDRHEALELRGGGTKHFYGEAPRGAVLDLRPLRGVIDYEPTELVVTVRCGEPLAEIEALLAEQDQHLAFEPPHFAAGGTVGGMVAAGLAGPARAAAGALRDHVLGVRLLNGRGEILRFGGQVMKNVAGYDVSRLLAGSLGILGILLEVSLKVLPLPAAVETLGFELPEAEALQRLRAWASRPLPVNASVWHEGRLWVRLAGAQAAVRAAAAALGGQRLDRDEAALWWAAVRDHRHPFFRLDDEALAAGTSLWRLSLPPTAPALELPGAGLVEWGGAQRWLRSSAPGEAVRQAAQRAGGHATWVRGLARDVDVFTPPSAVTMQLHRRLKDAFDPHRLFNPGRLFPDL
jgi:glycolate oxidase FAD binding subunit